MTSLPDFSEYEALKDWGLDVLVQHRQTLINERDKIDTAVKDIDKQIKPALASAGIAGVACCGWQVNVVPNNGRKRLDKVKLVELGVGPEIIEQAMVKGEDGDPYVVVKRMKGVGD